MENQNEPLLIMPSRTPKTKPKRNFCSKFLPTMGASTWFLCDFLCVFAKFVQKILNLSQKLGKSHTKPSAGDARLKWMLPCSNHINFCSIKEVLCKLCKIFEKSHEKSQEYNHVLTPIVGKDWGQKFLLVFVLGVPEGLINRGSFWFSIFTPSSVQCSAQGPSIDGCGLFPGHWPAVEL